MATTEPLTRSLVIDALMRDEIRHRVDDDGDIRITIVRQKGKDVSIYIFNPDTDGYFLSLLTMTPRFFTAAEMPQLVEFCNTWNREKRMPRAYVTGPDSDGDYTVKLDLHVRCENGTHTGFLQENILFYLSSSLAFWDELDEVT